MVHLEVTNIHTLISNNSHSLFLLLGGYGIPNSSIPDPYAQPQPQYGMGYGNPAAGYGMNPNMGYGANNAGGYGIVSNPNPNAGYGQPGPAGYF